MPAHAVTEPLILGPGEGTPVWFQGNRITIKATAAATGDAVGLIESLLPPGYSPPLHIHDREDETFYVLEGEVSILCGDRTFRAAPGACAFLPRGVPHTFVVEGDRPARMLGIMTPGGGEAFFAEGGRPADTDGFPPPEPPDLEQLRRVAARFGARIVGPPLAPSPRPAERTFQSHN
jgi:mannose-6-phosphate isomerase-like protein (cupin superfamily)